MIFIFAVLDARNILSICTSMQSFKMREKIKMIIILLWCPCQSPITSDASHSPVFPYYVRFVDIGISWHRRRHWHENSRWILLNSKYRWMQEIENNCVRMRKSRNKIMPEVCTLKRLNCWKLKPIIATLYKLLYFFIYSQVYEMSSDTNCQLPSAMCNVSGAFSTKPNYHDYYF